MARVNPAGLAQLRAQLSEVALAGAQGAADGLRERLSGEGSGVHYAGHPRRSSRAGEYPAQQTGRLRGSIAARPGGEMRAEFGPMDNPPGYVLALHFKPPSDGGRPFLDMALYDPDIHRETVQAITREAARLWRGARVKGGRP